jgi:hypothetical protein
VNGFDVAKRARDAKIARFERLVQRNDSNVVLITEHHLHAGHDVYLNDTATWRYFRSDYNGARAGVAVGIRRDLLDSSSEPNRRSCIETLLAAPSLWNSPTYTQTNWWSGVCTSRPTAHRSALRFFVHCQRPCASEPTSLAWTPT